MNLYLIHWPQPRRGRYVETWRAFEKLYAEGRIRAIGVSNFQITHLQRLLDETDIVPAVNQIELSPYLTQVPLRAFQQTAPTCPRSPGRRWRKAGNCCAIR